MSAVGCGVFSLREVSNWEASGVDDVWNKESRLRLMLLKLSCMGCWLAGYMGGWLLWEAGRLAGWEGGWLAAWEAVWQAEWEAAWEAALQVGSVEVAAGLAGDGVGQAGGSKT